MPGVFVVDWNPTDIQNRVSTIEAMDQEVCGAEAESPPHAVDALRETHPTVLVMWANDHLERTLQFLTDLRWAVDEVPPIIYVDADEAAEDELEGMAPGTFVPSSGLAAAIKQVAREARKR